MKFSSLVIYSSSCNPFFKILSDCVLLLVNNKMAYDLSYSHGTLVGLIRTNVLEVIWMEIYILFAGILISYLLVKSNQWYMMLLHLKILITKLQLRYGLVPKLVQVFSKLVRLSLIYEWFPLFNHAINCLFNNLDNDIFN